MQCSLGLIPLCVVSAGCTSLRAIQPTDLSPERGLNGRRVHRQMVRRPQ